MNQLPYCVLIVDDEPMVLELATRNYMRLGFLCDTAEDGDEAATKCVANNYDAVVTDLKMPNRNGHSLAVELLGQPSRPVVVVATAIISPRISCDLVIRGIDKVLHKPINHLQLAGNLRTLMQSRRSRLQQATQPNSTEARPASAESKDSHSKDASVAADSDDVPHRQSDCNVEMDRPHRVLVVDDEPMLRSLAQRAFINDGFECETAEDGCVAAKLFSERAYDAVVTDLRMPIRNGHSLALELLAHRPRPVVVITTGIIEPELSHDLMKRGAALVMHKPIDHSHLTATVRDLLNPSTESCNEDADSGDHHNNRDAETEWQMQTANGLMSESVDLYLHCTSMEHDANEIAAWVERDPELRDRIMEQANSCISDSPVSPADSTLQAVIRIGPKRVAQLAITPHE
jgi:DNA-binding response OmpR family regulator